MYAFKQKHSFRQENILFLSRSYKSKDEFVRKYAREKKLNYENTKSGELYLLILSELEKAISDGNIDNFRKFSDLVDYVNDVEDLVTLRDCYDNSSNSIRDTNLVILACKHNEVNILKYILESDSRILNNLSIAIRRSAILPDDEDGTCHNAFYYAIRSGNIELLDILISRWPNNYFTDNANLEELDKILSIAYEELKLKNVLLSDEMEVFVENKLISLHFFSDGFGQNQSVMDNLNNTRERIDLLFENINLLKIDYSDTEEVDQRFLFIAKSIAQNIHILKRQLKSTYIRLPWEEIEFCLVIFISSRTKRQEMNVFYHIILNKSKILSHIESFAKKLEDEKGIINIGKRGGLPRVNREKIIKDIISCYPQFEELYKDYQQIRDIHSLEIISDYMKLASSVDANEMEGQLIIVRALQVLGEHLKNTLESPKLSPTTSELLLLSLEKNARKIILSLRDSLSHTDSLSKRMEIEGNVDVSFFLNIQNDTKKIGGVIIDILYKSKINIIKIFLENFVSSENIDELKRIIEVLSSVKLDNIIPGNFKMTEHEKLKNMVQKVSDNLTGKTNYENELLTKMTKIIDAASVPENIRLDTYIPIYDILISSSYGINIMKFSGDDGIQVLKSYVKRELQNIIPTLEPNGLKQIADLTKKIAYSFWSRKPSNRTAEESKFILQIPYFIGFGAGDIKWVEDFEEQLNDKGSCSSKRKQRKTTNITEEQFNNYFQLKLSQLQSVLINNSLTGSLSANLPLYKGNRKLQAVIEMLVLDIMSIIIESSKNGQENNFLFLDGNTPLLNGKCLRNYLAHNNAVVDVLFSDPSITVLLNAQKLNEENRKTCEKKIGEFVRNDAFKLRKKYVQGLATISTQKKMFDALEEGNLDIVIDCLKNGADINARSIDLWTTLHFAAKGSSLAVIKFIFDQNVSGNDKDINGQSPLHVAATYGRQNIVKFFVEERGWYVDDLNNCNKTPLHVAAENGHSDTVEILLKNTANTLATDFAGISPIHHATKYMHINVVRILLEKDVNFCINESLHKFSLLYLAIRPGSLELVNLLLQNNANVNASSDTEFIPLHCAVKEGHLEIVNTLILNKADVNNVKAIDGTTALHLAIRKGNEKIAYILVKHGANVNAVEKTKNFTPLHYAAILGNFELVKTLLEYNATANIPNVDGQTSLHFAIRASHLDIVAILLKYDVDIHAKDKDNSSSLHFAAHGGHMEIAELLITKGAEINAKDNDNITPLHIAVLKGHKDVAALLIQNEGVVNAQGSLAGGTPLHAAAFNGNKDIINLLIEHEAQVNIRSNDGDTPLHLAADRGHQDAVDFLIKNKAEVNAATIHGYTPLHLAVQNGHRGVVSLLLANRAQVDLSSINTDRTPLREAVLAGNKEIVDILLENGANVNLRNCSDHQPPLYFAVISNRREIVEVLITKGADVNAEGTEFLLRAIAGGYVDILEILLKNGACANIKDLEDFTPLHRAAYTGHTKIVNALITGEADVNAVAGIDKLTPLFIAVHEGHADVVEVLIKSGASVNVKITNNCTPLHMAATIGHSNVVEVLLNNEAEVNAKDNKNNTPVLYAVFLNHLQVLKMLLKSKKVDVDTKFRNDDTILHIASRSDNLEVIKYLISEGSNINATTAFGFKPIHLAAIEGYKDIIEFFLSKGFADVNDAGPRNVTLLHYAAIKGHLELVKYLIAQGSDVNSEDVNGVTPIYYAAEFGCKGILEVLLQNGAVCNVADILGRKPFTNS